MIPAFGLGYEEVDENDIQVPGTFVDVTPFNPSVPTICLPLAPGDEPVTERWELVNLSSSDHNFHLHQAHFSVVTPANLPTTGVPSQLSGRVVMMDSVPLRHADGFCATVADWRNGLCTTYAPTVEVTFSIAGDFVYHCHILSHEDAGMMAVIRVRSAASSASPSVLEQMLSSVGIGSGGPHQPLKPPIQGALCAVPRQRG
jgi:plastocyanin